MKNGKTQNPPRRAPKRVENAKHRLDGLGKINETLGRIAEAIEKQRPSRFEQILMIFAAIATSLGVFSVLDVVVKWIGRLGG